MGNPIGRAVRSLRRDYPLTSLSSGSAIAVGATTAVLAVTTGGAALVAVPIIGGVVSGMGVLMFGMEEAFDRHGDNELDINGYVLVGDKKALTMIKRVQEFVEKKTDDLKHMEDLPEKLQRKLAKHIEDAQDALKNVRVYKKEYVQDKKGARYERTLLPQGSFSFMRECYNAEGKLVNQAFSAGDGFSGVVVPKLPSPPQKALPAPNSVTPEFSELAKRVEKVEAELKPKAVVLDKPAAPPSNPSNKSC